VLLIGPSKQAVPVVTQLASFGRVPRSFSAHQRWPVGPLLPVGPMLPVGPVAPVGP
jgi:hypothetical protein